MWIRSFRPKICISGLTSGQTPWRSRVRFHHTVRQNFAFFCFMFFFQIFIFYCFCFLCFKMCSSVEEVVWFVDQELLIKRIAYYILIFSYCHTATSSQRNKWTYHLTLHHSYLVIVRIFVNVNWTKFSSLVFQWTCNL